MKAVFIVYDQARGEEVINLLEKRGQRGYTLWQDIAGRGSTVGIPHLGNHAWPAMNNALLSFVEDSMVPQILADVKQISEEAKDLGVRAYAWQITDLF